MNKSLVFTLALIASLIVYPAYANQNAKPQAQSVAKNLVKMDNLGGGSACKDGKCGTAQNNTQSSGCCCSRRAKHEGDLSTRDQWPSDSDTRHEAMMERMKIIEDRLEQMHKLLQASKPKS